MHVSIASRACEWRSRTMSQEQYQYQPPAQASTGQQTSQFGQQTGQQRMGGTFDQSVSPKVKQAVSDLDQIETFAEYAKSSALEQGLIDAARAADDVKDLAHLQKNLVVRQSPIARTIDQCCAQACQQSLQTLYQYQNLPEVQELTSTLERSMQRVQQGIQSVGTSGQQYTGGQQQFW